MPIPLGLVLIGLGAGVAAAIASEPEDVNRVPGFPDWTYTIVRHPAMFWQQKGDAPMPIMPGQIGVKLKVGGVDWVRYLRSGSAAGAATYAEREARAIEVTHDDMWGGSSLQGRVFDMYRARAQTMGDPENVFQQGYTSGELGGDAGDAFEMLIFDWGDFWEVVLLGSPGYGEPVYIGRRDYQGTLSSAIIWGQRMLRAFAKTNWLHLTGAQRRALPPSQRPH